MANPKHLEILRQGVDVWNQWRQENPDILPNLESIGMDESAQEEVNISPFELRRRDLRGIDFSKTNLKYTFLLQAKLEDALLNGANLSGAILSNANLSNADLSNAVLDGANLRQAILYKTKLQGARLFETILSNIDLSETIDLDKCKHEGPSIIDFRTLSLSRSLPQVFLRGVGLPDLYIDYIPSLTEQPFEYYSAFISYSSEDEEFAQRIHADLQNNGVRCWYAPEDMQGGRKLFMQIDEAIRLHDKLILILSEHSLNSDWVAHEIKITRYREKTEKRQMLFPISITPFNNIENWSLFDSATVSDLAGEIRSYFIPDFTNWKDHDSYMKAFSRLLRDLKI